MGHAEKFCVPKLSVFSIVPVMEVLLLEPTDLGGPSWSMWSPRILCFVSGSDQSFELKSCVMSEIKFLYFLYLLDI